jgi:hypothetical protein
MNEALQNGAAQKPRYETIQELVRALEEIEALRETIVIDLTSWRHLAMHVDYNNRTWIKVDGEVYFGFRLWLTDYAQPLVIAAPCERKLKPGIVDLSE